MFNAVGGYRLDGGGWVFIDRVGKSVPGYDVCCDCFFFFYGAGCFT